MVVVLVATYSGCSVTSVFSGSGSNCLGGVNVGGGGGCILVFVDSVVVVWGTEEVVDVEVVDCSVVVVSGMEVVVVVEEVVVVS